MTIKSMTAFARQSGEAPSCLWTWEIKSVNAKGLDIRFRMPAGFDALDIAIRDTTAKMIGRGNLFIALTVKWREEASQVRVNETLLKALGDLAPEIQSAFPGAAMPTIDGLMALKGVVEVVEAGESDELRDALFKPMLDSYRQALTALISMRAEEGARLMDAFDGQLTEIGSLRDRAEALAETQPATLKAKMTAHVQEILGPDSPVAEDRLAQEIALLVTKADIREELDRLTVHIAAARDLLAQDGPVGRKLDFLCQEFNREVNTICSKAHGTEVTAIGLDLKAVIEQFREQVQNIE